MSIKTVFRMMRDVYVFGPQMLRLHLAQQMGSDRIKLDLRQVGPVTVRLKDSDMDVIRQVFIGHQYELANAHSGRLQAAYERLLARGRVPLIIDAGANVGAGSLWFSARFPKARILALEPDAATVDICRQNTAPHKQITVLQSAIGGKAGAVELAPAQYSMSVQTVRSEGPGAVPIMTVDDVVAAAGPDAELFIVKIDIEGFEADLFANNTEWIQKPVAIYVEPHDWMLPGKGSSQSMRRALFDADFEVLIAGENLVFVRDEPKAVLN